MGKEGVDNITDNFNTECELLRRMQGRARVTACFAVCDVVHDGKNTKAPRMGNIPDAADMHPDKRATNNHKPTDMWERICYQLHTSVMGMINSDVANSDQTPSNILVGRDSNAVPIGMGKAATRDTWDVYSPKAQAAGRPAAHRRAPRTGSPMW